MKKIQFKSVQMQIGEEEVTLDYKKEIMSLLLIPLDPQAGTKYEEMAVVLPIHAKFKQAGLDHVLLEDAEHEEVIKRLKNAQFRQNTPEIFEMIRSIVELSLIHI